MTTSGTYAFNPAISDFTLAAYARLGMKAPQLLPEHLQDSYRESNFLLAEFANKGPNLWKSELVSQDLTQGVETYALDSSVVSVILAYINTSSGSTVTSRVIGPLSTVDYNSIPVKATQGAPTSFWFNRIVPPEIKLWPVPDGDGPYTLKLRIIRQIQDANLPNGQTADVPYRFVDAFVAGLAHRLARIHKPELEQLRKADAMEAWGIAAKEDTENVPMFITPGLSGYFRA